jgi:carboxylate-amine ligase
MALEFIGSSQMSLGVEMELQIIDAKTKDLFPGSPRIFEIMGGEQRHIKPELVQAMIEINTDICSTVGEVRRDLEKQIARLQSVAATLGLEFSSSGSHPFARYTDRLIYPAERYNYLIDRNQWMARRLMIFGLHIHVGMRDGDHAIALNNAMLHYIPHVLALSASSPFWQGMDTGLASCRVTVFEALPTAGHPCTFTSWGEFESFYNSMIASQSISSIKDIWWDIRPHPDYGTIELRVCDSLPTLQETTALIAFVQALFHWFDEQYQNGRRFLPPPYWILRENKWKASRHGLDAEIILDERGTTRPLRQEIEILLQQLEPFARRAQSWKELYFIADMIHRGGSYLRQRAIYKKEGTFLAVAEALVEEFRRAAPLYPGEN